MKPTSLRTWLAVATVALVLAGAGVVYVVRNPQLPPGWTMHEKDEFRVAVPTGDGFMYHRAWRVPCYYGPFNSDVRVRIRSWDLFDWPGTYTPGAEMEEHFEQHFRSRPEIRVNSCQRVIVYGRSAYVLSTDEEENARKHLVVVGKGRLYDVCTDIVSGVFTEADADRVFRSFHPR